jgi:hypothetical protein
MTTEPWASVEDVASDDLRTRAPALEAPAVTGSARKTKRGKAHA